MGLKQNKVLLKQNCFSLKSGGVFTSHRQMWETPKMFNVYDTLGDLTSFPHGYAARSSWLMPRKVGGMSTYNSGEITFTANSLNVAQGVNGVASTSFSFTSGAVVGSAVASGVGNASIVFTSSGTASAPINRTGTSSIAFTGNNSALQASALITGTTNFSITGNNLNSFGLGYMIAVPIESTLTPAAISEAVWGAVAASNDVAGTMGEKLNDASAAGNPWSATLASNNTSGTFGWYIQKLITVAKFLAFK
jgi:hypothetical protein